MREIVLDTETTGLNPLDGHRLVEIGCVELLNRTPTKNSYHVFINPEREVPSDAYKIHGLSTEFLSDKPKLPEIVDEFLKFIEDSDLVIHNADFDMKFINWELKNIGYGEIPKDRVIDSLALARKKFPAGPNSLNALCSRYNIDNSKRVKHGALLDAELLSEVYIELTGGKQNTLNLNNSAEENETANQNGSKNQANRTVKARSTPLPPRITEEEIAAHSAFIAEMGEEAVWRKYQ